MTDEKVKDKEGPDLTKSGPSQPDPAVSNVATAQKQQEKEQALKDKREDLDEDESLDPDDLLTTELVETEFYIAQNLDPRRLIPGSSRYLDDVEREEAERVRAKVEDREPDLENPPAVQGTPVVSAAHAEHQGLSTAQVEPYATLEVSQNVSEVDAETVDDNVKSNEV